MFRIPAKRDPHLRVIAILKAPFTDIMRHSETVLGIQVALALIIRVRRVKKHGCDPVIRCNARGYGPRPIATQDTDIAKAITQGLKPVVQVNWPHGAVFVHLKAPTVYSLAFACQVHHLSCNVFSDTTLTCYFWHCSAGENTLLAGNLLTLPRYT